MGGVEGVEKVGGSSLSFRPEGMKELKLGRVFEISFSKEGI